MSDYVKSLMGIVKVMDTPEFKKQFWDWFDNLPKEEKTKFNEYKSDMATMYFYNKIWVKQNI
jgi:hypothetical protein